MGAPPHPPEKRAEAIAALYASATVDGDELLPHFRAVERQTGINVKVLTRWWATRDKSLDVTERNKATSRAAAAALRGAETWGNLVQDGLRKVGQRALELLSDEDRFKRAKYDEASRGLKGLGETLKIVDTTLKELDAKARQDADTEIDTALDGAVRNAMQKDLPQGAGSPQGES